MSTVARTRAVSLSGIEGSMVEVEAHMSQGLPHFSLTGLPDKACGQAPDRVIPAAVSSGVPIVSRRVTVNLSPAAIPKAGTGFDLAIAIAVLAAQRAVSAALVAPIVHLGELGLDGQIRSVRGVLPAVMHAAAAGVRTVVVPVENAAEAQLVQGVRVHAAPDLRTLVGWYSAAAAGVPLPTPAAHRAADGQVAAMKDLADVVGQHQARAALEVAATGGHHLLLGGPPGVGKTMLAERLVGILPRLSREQALQSLAVRSLAGGVAAADGLDRVPPFVAPHHSASVPSIVGGGSSSVLPGAISRAHHGVLFLDEAAEFPSSVLQTLRQPLESGEVVIARARQVIRYPSRFLLVLATNPCPCGHGHGKAADCSCRPQAIRSYFAKLSGPLLDRVDIRVDVPSVPTSALAGGAGESSAVVAARVRNGRAAAAVRWAEFGFACNGEAPGPLLRRSPFRLAATSTLRLEQLLDRGQLSLRGYDRALRVAWTLADLAGRSVPTREDVETALGLRASSLAAA